MELAWEVNRAPRYGAPGWEAQDGLGPKDERSDASDIAYAPSRDFTSAKTARGEREVSDALNLGHLARVLRASGPRQTFQLCCR